MGTNVYPVIDKTTYFRLDWWKEKIYIREREKRVQDLIYMLYHLIVLIKRYFLSVASAVVSIASFTTANVVTIRMVSLDISLVFLFVVALVKNALKQWAKQKEAEQCFISKT